MTRTFAPLLGLTALAALTLLAPAARAQTTYTAVDLTPNGMVSNDFSAVGFSVSGSTQVGYFQADNIGQHALLWHGTAASVVDLNPTFSSTAQSLAEGVFGNTQVGQADSPDELSAAVLWHGTAASIVYLNPVGYDYSEARGVDSDTQVGDGDNIATQNSHALLWHGTADSVVDLSPKVFGNGAYALGVSGSTQVGYTSDATHFALAVLWHGTADSMVFLNPPGSYFSQALGVDGDTQVGQVAFQASPQSINAAVLWHGTADSIVKLTTSGTGAAYGVSGSTQVGYDANSQGQFAAVWHGTASSEVNLGAFLPKGFTGSIAYGVSPSGDVVGRAYNQDTGIDHAFLWHPVASPALTVASLSPDVVDVGSAAFTLQVSGSQFVPSTVVRYNGQTLTTTYLRSNLLTASVPASLVARTGTADITAQTPGVATSGAATFHIRPLIASLSPSTKTAGASAFTLTVNGTGFPTNSIVVFDGVNISTTYVSFTKLTATVPASLLTTHRRVDIMVTIPHVATSRGFGFDVTP